MAGWIEVRSVSGSVVSANAPVKLDQLFHLDPYRVTIGEMEFDLPLSEWIAELVSFVRSGETHRRKLLLFSGEPFVARRDGG